MEFIIDNEYFNKAISDVSKAVSLKTPFPILTGIKMTACDNCLILVGSNSDIVIEKIIPFTIDGVQVLDVYKTGSVVISAKYLSEIVKKLPDKIHFKVNEKQLVTIQSNEIITNLQGFSAEDYPSFPQIDEAEYIEIPSVELIEIIKQTVFAVSKSESRPVLTGVNMSFKDNQLTCVATNSQRLALRELAIESSLNGSFIVPGTSLNELTKLINNESGVIHIFVIDNYIVFKLNTISLFSRLIGGNYPNVSGLLPSNSKTIITLNTNQLLKGIDRACLFASEWKNNNVNLEINDGTKIKISSNSSEIGKIEETQTIKTINGEIDLSISLDGSFLMDALKVIKEEEIRISFGGPMKPILIEPIDNSSFIHLISPVRSY
ncbi:DNA polymerase III subunit beta [Lysinibacillus sp. 2017]|uniref:DNA polymerase III subunit beta n=1 Tax=unclassified Lysinibacillus TaxID=2636778 RepID=UPI000D528C66|nr:MULTISPECIES: DNA polymerase III subunit beta [unclassified Lysinibacillus]AWE07632.1 DNA polymerase III subunit beta [Lysinibacillus sp. 2017]TGN36795.1 DNA polymerase III subunit beta [Lysinibacillus sp. S2017]